MQEGGGRLAGDASVAVGRSCHDPLEQSQDTTHLGDAVQSGHEMHLRGSGVGERYLDPLGDESGDDLLSSVHWIGFTSPIIHY
jgi:hypothetical protein